ncbi:bifunctional diaminohydroxyphosphoribosylaminopyrimidine deaminase/5-amino-6-(5-phosphoribosylamino)uracil reductase RibD [Maricaulis sp.]|jgi:diaminohydroxyphosphoribosylaminopyrimidine deaminase / 5-amino-6-(5-phosphoribosylamino)uracil reductase|uniref:bifunctional diaminohydroxyphosphoribosylaminopyrimidine deaminase/5-amino-6-(5-phosphoribosylamino)uracil reductase RibD n=1 Tax=Maricaulis sp. TaxID=1486257 RepID=UPI002638230B|nr:bifunctional diaminohydroxyphosphoribosylaminopyrimidine deaminase/5-amino-6-(5-phosphoribosylamino)uracil reductase RibD [Maricaulis sp.]MDF1768136.1 bifunctional diaminohydroxyphosphoribosylaminopyrimidine deaminase/5-amino-6-(5-phosphoribosylamino)uracil reductase RibD [Maricaulis sp.]
MSTVDDRRYMDLALALARAQQGRTAPNPAVGCVLVKTGRILATGSTRDGGRPHAERVALDRAGDAAKGATAYVTLEPCAHHGQTPPCAQGLIDAGITRVVIACRDEFPHVAGKGVAMLQAAAIATEIGPGRADAHALYAGFFQRLETGLPQVRVDDRAHGYDAELRAETIEAAEEELKAHGRAGVNRICIAPDHPLAGRNWLPALPD